MIKQKMKKENPTLCELAFWRDTPGIISLHLYEDKKKKNQILNVQIKMWLVTINDDKFKNIIDIQTKWISWQPWKNKDIWQWGHHLPPLIPRHTELQDDG